MRVTTRSIRQYMPIIAASAGLCLLSLTACSGSSPASTSGSGAAAGGGSSAARSAASGGSPGKAGSPCTLVTAAELSQAVGVHYKTITAAGNLCAVMGPGPASFDFTVQKVSPTNTWSQQVAIIKGDDGQALSEPGIGDRAVWGGKEFAAEADGYIVGVIGADFPSTPQGSGFVRTGKIAKLLISKL
jgi:hypothetical protein